MSDIGSEGKPASLNLERQDEDGYIHLPEDRWFGKIIFLRRYLNDIIFSYERLLYFMLSVPVFVFLATNDIKSWPHYLALIAKWSAVPLCFPTSLCLWHYGSFFWLDQAGIPLVVLIYLIKEVELQSSRDSDVNWRRIAFFANQLSQGMNGTLEVFYGGDHCMRYYNKCIVGAVQKQHYRINVNPPRCVFGSKGSVFGIKSSHRDLMDRSVQSYLRITEPVHEV